MNGGTGAPGMNRSKSGNKAVPGTPVPQPSPVPEPAQSPVKIVGGKIMGGKNMRANITTLKVCLFCWLLYMCVLISDSLGS